MSELRKFNEGKAQLRRIRAYLLVTKHVSTRRDWGELEDAWVMLCEHEKTQFREIDRQAAQQMDDEARDALVLELQAENVRLKAILADVREAVNTLSRPKEFSSFAQSQGWDLATSTAIRLIEWALSSYRDETPKNNKENA